KARPLLRQDRDFGSGGRGSLLSGGAASRRAPLNRPARDRLSPLEVATLASWEGLFSLDRARCAGGRGVHFSASRLNVLAAVDVDLGAVHVGRRVGAQHVDDL